MSRLRAEDGFTLVELLVTMVIMLVIFAAALGALEAFQRQSRTDNARGDNQDAVRRTVDHVAEGLRGMVGTGTAAAVDRAGTNDLVFRVVDPAIPPQSGGSNTAHLMFRRYCVDPSQAFYEESLHWTSPSAPGLPSTTCPGSGWENVQKLADHITTAGGNIFTYLPDPTAVSRVGIDLSIDLDAARPPVATRLRSSVTLRNLNSPPTVVLTCQAVGGGQIVCDTFGTADPDGGALTYAWSSGSDTTCTALSTLASTQSQVNQAGLSAGDYCFKVTVTDPTGMAASATQVVTAR